MNKNYKTYIYYLPIFLIAMLLQCHIFYPGYMSFDSAFQYSQVVSGEWNNISPIVMVFLWTLTDAIIPGPGGLFLLFQIIALTGLIIFVAHLNWNYWLKTVAIFLVFFWPYNLMIMPHLWKDVGLMSFLFLALGLIQIYKQSAKNRDLILATVTLIVASMFRFEAVFYLLPVVFYLVVLFCKHHNSNKHWLKASLFSVLFILASVTTTQLITHLSNSKKITLWQTVALWDLARVSVKTHEMLLPEFTTGKNITINELSEVDVTWTNLHVFTKTRAGVNAGLIDPYSHQQNKKLFKAWLGMIQNHPLAYLAHRTEVSAHLLRIKESPEQPIDFFYTRNNRDFPDGHTFNNNTINSHVTTWINKHLDYFYFKGWFYLSLQLLLLIYFLVTTNTSTKPMATALSCSGVLSVLVLLFASPSAEQRYLVWLVNSTLLTSLLFLEHLSQKKAPNGRLDSIP